MALLARTGEHAGPRRAPTGPSVAPLRRMVSPADEVDVERPAVVDPPGERSRRWWTWLLVCLAVLVGGLLTANAGASPAKHQPPGQPVPTVDTCEPGSFMPVCWPSTTSAPVPTDELPLPTGTPTPIPPPVECVPGQLNCGGPPTTTKPCEGEDCIPQPTSPAPGPNEPGGPEQGENGEPDCGLTNITGCIAKAINAVFKGIAQAALNPILDLLGTTALSTPLLADLPGIGELWNNSWSIVVAVYGLLILVGGIVVMSHESLQSRYSIKEIGPRIPVAFIASMLSLFFSDKLIRLANALSTAVIGGGVNPPSMGDTLQEAVNGALTGGLFIILIGLVLVIVGIGLLIVYVVRVAITLILVVAGPLFLMCHCLPHTDPLARWWWKAMTATLAIQVVQSLVLITAVNTFLSGGVLLFGSFSALAMLISAIALFYILFKIPFWMLSAVKVSSGRSLVGGLVKAYIAAKTFGMVTGGSGWGGGGRAGVVAPVGATGRGRRAPADPPMPAQPHLPPTSAEVARRLRSHSDAERARAARRSRVPSLAPRFLQPTPQTPTHDPTVDLASAAAATSPAFSSAPAPSRPIPPPPRRPSPPRFQGTAQSPPARPVQVAAVPPQLRFQPATAAPASAPASRASSAPAAPTFRPAHREPRVGAGQPRTSSVPPVAFRAPQPRGDTT